MPNQPVGASTARNLDSVIAWDGTKSDSVQPDGTGVVMHGSRVDESSLNQYIVLQAQHQMPLDVCVRQTRAGKVVYSNLQQQQHVNKLFKVQAGARHVQAGANFKF